MVAEGRGSKKWKGKKKASNPSIKCWYCEEERHIQTKCSKYKEDLMALKDGRNRAAASIAIEEETDVSLMVEESKGPKEDWIFDS